jgi:ABC-2 type transport system ATP-binding protein
MGYLAQSPLLYDKLTGREFLRFLGGLHGLSDALSEERGESLLGLMELSGKADQLIESYSGGMRKRLGLCGALLHEPPVLVLDEPFTGLDPYGARRIKDLLHHLCRQGSTIFLSTHVLEIAERVCDRVGILNHGRLVAAGTVEDLRRQAQSTSETTLEDLFMQLTAGETEAMVVSALDEGAP